jgi:hypothetical protein
MYASHSGGTTFKSCIHSSFSVINKELPLVRSFKTSSSLITCGSSSIFVQWTALGWLRKMGF